MDKLFGRPIVESAELSTTDPHLKFVSLAGFAGARLISPDGSEGWVCPAHDKVDLGAVAWPLRLDTCCLCGERRQVL